VNVRRHERLSGADTGRIILCVFAGGGVLFFDRLRISFLPGAIWHYVVFTALTYLLLLALLLCMPSPTSSRNPRLDRRVNFGIMLYCLGLGTLEAVLVFRPTGYLLLWSILAKYAIILVVLFYMVRVIRSEWLFLGSTISKRRSETDKG